MNSAPKSPLSFPIDRLTTRDPETGNTNAVVETPRGHRNKYKYEPGLGLFKLHKVLPTGFVYPFDFGFIPATLGEDGDPLDILILMDEPAFTGCLVPVQIIGVIEAEQTEKGKTFRNDRLIGVASVSLMANDLKEIKDVDGRLLDEIEQFFISYEQIEGKQFKPVGRFGAKRARKLIDEGAEAFLRNLEE